MADDSGNKAVVLLSGGLDSATCLAIALDRGFACHCLSFAYGQRHSHELGAARRIAAQLGAAEHKTVPLDLRAFGGSALTDDIDVPKDQPSDGIPVTYVPARNLVFLSLAIGFAEVLDARHIFVGLNAVDYSGYPDCRPEFVEAFNTAANLATKAGVEGDGFKIETPLIDLPKAAIIKAGLALGVDFGMTHSCYDPDDSGAACGRCDSCLIRKRGFADADVPDPTRYQGTGA